MNLTDKEYSDLESKFTAYDGWQCNQCGELIGCDVDSMISHLESCEDLE